MTKPNTTEKAESAPAEVGTKVIGPRIYVYSLPPTDWWWGWMTESQLFEKMCKEYREFGKDLANAIHNYFNYFYLGERLALELGWEGVGEIYVTRLPVTNDEQFVIAWQQTYNGTTFVVSPTPLPWIKLDEFHQMISSNNAEDPCDFLDMRAADIQRHGPEQSETQIADHDEEIPF